MTVITFILVYILVGIIFTAVSCWDVIYEVFERCEPDSTNPLNPLNGDEWQEFTTLILTCLFGWGVLLIIVIIDSIKGIWKK